MNDKIKLQSLTKPTPRSSIKIKEPIEILTYGIRSKASGEDLPKIITPIDNSIMKSQNSAEQTTNSREKVKTSVRHTLAKITGCKDGYLNKAQSKSPGHQLKTSKLLDRSKQSLHNVSMNISHQSINEKLAERKSPINSYAHQNTTLLDKMRGKTHLLAALNKSKSPSTLRSTVGPLFSEHAMSQKVLPSSRKVSGSNLIDSRVQEPVGTSQERKSHRRHACSPSISVASSHNLRGTSAELNLKLTNLGQRLQTKVEHSFDRLIRQIKDIRKQIILDIKSCIDNGIVSAKNGGCDSYQISMKRIVSDSVKISKAIQSLLKEEPVTIKLEHDDILEPINQKVTDENIARGSNDNPIYFIEASFTKFFEKNTKLDFLDYLDPETYFQSGGSVHRVGNWPQSRINAYECLSPGATFQLQSISKL